MKFSLSLLNEHKEIEEKRLLNYINTPEEKQSTLHYEHIEDIKNQISDYEKTIVILKQFGSFSDLDKNTIVKLTNKLNYLESLIKIKFNNI